LKLGQDISVHVFATADLLKILYEIILATYIVIPCKVVQPGVVEFCRDTDYGG